MVIIRTDRSSRQSQPGKQKMKLSNIQPRLTMIHREQMSQQLAHKSKDSSGYASAWINRWSMLHMAMSLICTGIYYRTSLMSAHGGRLTFFARFNNRTMIGYKYLNWIHYDWCSPSSSSMYIPGDQIIVNQAVLLMCVTCGMVFVTAWLVYLTLNEKLVTSLTSRRQVSRYKWFILVMLLGCSVCSQWISSVTCQAIPMLDDTRYTAMFILQLIGFIACLHFAYGLGSVLKPLLYHRQTSTPANTSTSDSDTLLFSKNELP